MAAHPWPRRIRRLCAALLFAAALASFADISGRLASAYAAGQLGPAIARLAAAFSGAALGVVAATLLLTFAFGRFYCAAACPLGVLQDGMDWAAGFFVKRAPRPAPNHRRLRYAIALVSLGALAGGWAIGFRAFDPFTRFGATAAVTFAPAYTAVQNAAFPARAVAAPPITASGLAAGLLPPAALLALVVWRRRVFCTAICPVGTLLGVCAGRGWLRLRMDRERCNACGRCARVCPAGVIDPVAGSLDNERCVRCMNCLAACRRGAIRYGGAPAAADSGDGDESPRPAAVSVPSPARREFLRGGTAAALTAVAAFSGGRLYRSHATSRMPRMPRTPDPDGGGPASPEDAADMICPPGAGTTARFAARCTGCHLCLMHCDGRVLRAATPDRPAVHLDFDEGLCEFNCLQCVKVCPTGALRPMELKEKQRLRLGLAVFFQEICVAVVEERDCGACAEHCPTGALRMRELKPGIRIPVLTPELCIGCGNCQYPCPVRPHRAIQIRPVAAQTRADDPEDYFRRHPPPELTPPPAMDDGEWLI